VCISCPQACMHPFSARKESVVSSSKGRASMSARKRIAGVPLSPAESSQTTPPFPRSIGLYPMESKAFFTYSVVFGKENPHSAKPCKRRRALVRKGLIAAASFCSSFIFFSLCFFKKYFTGDGGILLLFWKKLCIINEKERKRRKTWNSTSITLCSI